METKEEIVKRYISEHKNDHYWYQDKPFTKSTFIDIYSKLIGGDYGECRETDFGDFEIEISKHQTKSMQTVIFSFNKPGE
jgi:hypothetical protein